MSRSADPGHFFQSAAALDNASRKAQKSANKNGNPIVLPSKILAIVTDDSEYQSQPAVFVAEGAGTVKRVRLDSGQITAILRPETSSPAPLTCLALSPIQAASSSGSRSPRTLYSGSWDKNVYSWTLHMNSSGEIRRTDKGATFRGHLDFVKAVIGRCLDGRDILLSASADGNIIVWDSCKREKLYTLQGHGRGVLAIAVDPYTLTPDGAEAVFSGDSKNEIRCWAVKRSGAKEIPIPQSKETTEDENSSQKGPFRPLIRHETSIYALAFETMPDSSFDMWTASADKSAKCLSRSNHWAVDTVLQHPDFVKDIVIDQQGGRVVTACRDEDVRLWDKSSGELVHTFSGHFEEVTGVAYVHTKSHYGVASVSIDGTVRFWSLLPLELEQAMTAAQNPAPQEDSEVSQPKESLLTAEEEAELADLMSDD